mmetsp:Transcript_67654/g.218516  ORF Transcript_67654/g.218516 Transcript_67654/m.218516 type:complete len:95 (+) Transcript_67654:127-411(+)
MQNHSQLHSLDAHRALRLRLFANRMAECMLQVCREPFSSHRVSPGRAHFQVCLFPALSLVQPLVGTAAERLLQVRLGQLISLTAHSASMCTLCN